MHALACRFYVWQVLDWVHLEITFMQFDWLMNTQQRMLELLQQHNPLYTLDQPFYTDEEIFQADLENIFYQRWIFAIHDFEIPKTGDYLTYQFGTCNVVLVRDKSGQISAFHNSCRHRGSRVCNQEKGNTHRFVCPYHHWTYDLSGSLIYAKNMGDDFNVANFSLKKVHCATIGTEVFICIAATPPDITQFKQTVDPYLLPHSHHPLKVAHQATIIEKGNWKLVIENNRECYHCSVNHPELCVSYSDDPAVTGKISPDSSEGFVAAHWQKCESYGLPSKFAAGEDATYRVARMPLIGNNESFTLNGKVACKKPLTQANDKKLGSTMFYCYPNTWSHYLSDHIITFRVTPISATVTKVTTKWIVRADAIEGKNYDLENLIKVWEATNDQDRILVERNQLGINSPAYTPGPYSNSDEEAVREFIQWYAQATNNSSAVQQQGELLNQSITTIPNTATATPPIPNTATASPPIPSTATASPPTPITTTATNETEPIHSAIQAVQRKYTAPQPSATLALLQPQPAVDNAATPSIQREAPGSFYYLNQITPWDANSELLEVVNVIPEVENTVTFSFRPTAEHWFSFAPGQFITLELTTSKGTLYRTFTISSSPSRPLSISCTIKRQPNSIGVAWMFENLRVGSKVRAFGPVGEFHLFNYPADKYLFISGGSGITPMLSMTKYLYDKGGEIDISFVHSARKPSEIIAYEDMQKICARMPAIKLAWIIEEREQFVPWAGYMGRINQLILELTTPDYFEREVFCCGPAPFMQAVRDILNVAAFNMQHYHEESFATPVVDSQPQVLDDFIPDASMTTTITFTNSDTSIAANQTQTILEISRAAALHIPNACQFGVCGTCKIKKISGDVHMVHNGGISDEEIADGYILACCSTPITDVSLAC